MERKVAVGKVEGNGLFTRGGGGGGLANMLISIDTTDKARGKEGGK